jgi:hypothetical protein
MHGIGFRAVENGTFDAHEGDRAALSLDEEALSAMLAAPALRR